MLAGKPRWMGLGPLALFGLQEARAKALDAGGFAMKALTPSRRGRRRGSKHGSMRPSRSPLRNVPTSYIAAHKAGWHNPKHAAQWTATLATYAEPIIGALPVQAVDTALVPR